MATNQDRDMVGKLTALNTNVVLENRMSAIQGDLIIGCIAVLDSEIKVFNIDIEIRLD